MPSADPAPRSSPTAERATLSRRFAGFVLDWVLAALVTFLLLPYDLVLEPGEQPPVVLGVPESSWAVLGIFVVLNVVLVSLTGSTLGHRLLGLQVWQVRRWPFPVQVLVRSVLAGLVVPAVVTVGGRGLHDLAAGTRTVRVRRSG
ncbi:RDD family protein [Phycicoccus endophyticus]|uniref:RDD family protein n=1 Tax=Phycicoccus endophyticus TaxID=1690220 RepID=A0A7G9R523_9MICO|nr:RDD family protein [Phycicoccus endophyticus]NHI20883.1 RDD family protein [Phycicoccus endophyticus]QNN50698.1 RDD family protein [Phycicoccus endophyticus]GGL22202.1 hypothetical protein GCM10012283_00340 [Phycicoccus endophyticus]